MKYTQLQRFQQIDRLLYLNPEGLSTAKILEEINRVLSKDEHATISLRQLQMDLQELKKQLKAPISGGRGRRKVRYDNAAFCIFNKTYCDYKLDAKSLQGRLNWLRTLIQYMEKAKYDEQVMEVMDFEDNLKLANIDRLPTILWAIINRKVLRLEYAATFSEQVKTQIVHPYFLHQYNHRWYLFALYRQRDNLREGERPDKSRNTIISYALDRIMDVSELGSGRIRYVSISLNKLREIKKEKFKHIVGIRNDSTVDPVNLTLSFDLAGKPEGEEKPVDGRLFYNLLKSNPFYGDFEFSSDDTCGTAQCTIKPNPELYNNLMMYAHAAHISDEGIRGEIIRRARAILATQGAAPSQDPPTEP